MLVNARAYGAEGFLQANMKRGSVVWATNKRPVGSPIEKGIEGRSRKRGGEHKVVLYLP